MDVECHCLGSKKLCQILKSWARAQSFFPNSEPGSYKIWALICITKPEPSNQHAFYPTCFYPTCFYPMCFYLMCLLTDVPKQDSGLVVLAISVVCEREKHLYNSCLLSELQFPSEEASVLIDWWRVPGQLHPHCRLKEQVAEVLVAPVNLCLSCSFRKKGRHAPETRVEIDVMSWTSRTTGNKKLCFASF